MKINKERTGCILSVRTDLKHSELKTKMNWAVDCMPNVFVPSDVSFEGKRYTFYISHRQSLKEYIYEYGITVKEFFVFLNVLGELFESAVANEIFPYDFIFDYECIFVGDTVSEMEFIYAPDADVCEEGKVIYNKCSDIAAIISLHIDMSDAEQKEAGEYAVQEALKVLFEWEQHVTADRCIFPKDKIAILAAPWTDSMKIPLLETIKNIVNKLLHIYSKRRDEADKMKLNGKLLLQGMNFAPENIIEKVHIGRDSTWADVPVGYSFVSRKHAMLYREKDEWYIKDLNSKNGTFVDGVKIKSDEPFNLKNGCEISLGVPETKFILCLP